MESPAPSINGYTVDLRKEASGMINQRTPPSFVLRIGRDHSLCKHTNLGTAKKYASQVSPAEPPSPTTDHRYRPFLIPPPFPSAPSPGTPCIPLARYCGRGQGEGSSPATQPNLHRQRFSSHSALSTQHSALSTQYFPGLSPKRKNAKDLKKILSVFAFAACTCSSLTRSRTFSSDTTHTPLPSAWRFASHSLRH